MKHRNAILGILLLSLMLLAGSCKTEFEKIRTSQDPAVIAEAAHKLFDQGNYLKALTLYEIIIPIYRGRQEAEQIFYNYAYAHYHQKQYILASHYFKNFANTYTSSEKREECDFMSAYSNYKLSPHARLDQSYSQTAIDGFQLFANSYPNSARIEECTQLIDELRSKMETKAFEQGKLYYKLGQYSASTTSFDNMLKDFPESNRAEEVRFLIAKSSYELAKNSIYEKQRVRYLKMIEKGEDFLKRYQNSDKYKEVESYVIKSTKELKKFENG